MTRLGSITKGVALALVLVALAPARVPAAPAPTGAVSKLCDEYWNGWLRLNPVQATSIGDHRFDALLDDNSPAGIAAVERFLNGFLARARAIDPQTLSPADQLNRAALIEEMEGRLAGRSCHFERWNVDARNGPQVDFMNLPDYTVIATPKDGAAFVARVKRMGPYIDQTVRNLRAGLAEGKVASHQAVSSTVEELDAVIAQPVEQWALVAPGNAERPTWKASERAAFLASLTAAAKTGVAPAFVRFRAFLYDELLPKTRTDEKPGLASMPGGIECYRKLIRVHTSLDQTPEELHQLGLDQVKRVRAALSELGGKALGTTDVSEIQRRLRTDPAMHFKTADQVETKARETLARAKAAIPNWFDILPKANCEVKVIGMHEAPFTTIAYYREPAADGSRPGNYMINTYKPETRPTYEAEALAFHESIPGHHLQIAIAQELTGLPEFRKYVGVTAFVEGWGLYTERLADDMGLYSSDVDRIGMLSFDAWRACRLVVDTGLHAMGWSRQQAIDYMKENTVLAENNIANEVDRYIGDPGQALAYKVGQLELLRLRDEAKTRLGAKFDIKAFHDAVLRNGAVALPVLRAQVESYIAQTEAAK